MKSECLLQKLIKTLCWLTSKHVTEQRFLLMPRREIQGIHLSFLDSTFMYSNSFPKGTFGNHIPGDMDPLISRDTTFRCLVANISTRLFCLVVCLPFHLLLLHICNTVDMQIRWKGFGLGIP